MINASHTKQALEKPSKVLNWPAWLISFCVLSFWSVFSMAQEDQEATFSVVYYDNYAPYAWTDNHSEVKGVFVDIIDSILSKHMQLSVSHIGLPWGRAQRLVEQGKVDAMIAPVTEARLDYALSSRDAIWEGNFVLFTRHDHPDIQSFARSASLAQLKSARFVTQIGDGWANQNLKNYNLKFTHDLNSVLSMLSLGRADLFVEDELVGTYNIGLLDMADTVNKVPGFQLKDTDYHLFVSKKSPHRKLISQINDKLRLLKEAGDFKKIVARYLK